VEGDYMSVRNSRREFFGLAAGALATVSLFPKRAMGRSASATDIDHIGEAIRKIQAHSAELAKT
jgi:hypothetical protein